MTELNASIKDAMGEYLAGIAEWRRRKADEYDRDTRNLRAAAAIDELANFVRTLDEDDPRLLRLTELAMQGERFEPGQQTSYEIGRFKFFSEAGDVDSFLTRVVELAELDAGEHGHFGGKMPEGDDPWG